VRDDRGEFTVLTGNQVGVLLCDYIIRTKKEGGVLPDNAAIVKTIVTTDLAKKICEAHGVTMVETLTGFKYIGEAVGEWEKTKQKSFLLGFEESYGYLAGDFVRDKDAVIAAVLIAEMALYYKTQNMTLFHALQDVFRRYGYTKEKLISVTMPGAEGQGKIKELLNNLRADPQAAFSSEELVAVEDYGASVKTIYPSGEKEILALPKSNVLKFIFGDESWLVIRPSGTEPKVKVYLAAGSEERLFALEDAAKTILK
jgi:phosphoglucomutase